MSTTSCLLLLLFCLSLHACSSRRLAADDKKLERRSHMSNRNVRKDISVAPKMESSSSKEHEAAKGDSTTGTHSNDNVAEDSSARTEQVAQKNAKGSAGVQNESLVSVSWRVPKQKRGEQHPAFNLDYSPPMTHPPSHNR